MVNFEDLMKNLGDFDNPDDKNESEAKAEDTSHVPDADESPLEVTTPADIDVTSGDEENMSAFTDFELPTIQQDNILEKDEIFGDLIKELEALDETTKTTSDFEEGNTADSLYGDISQEDIALAEDNEGIHLEENLSPSSTTQSGGEMRDELQETPSKGENESLENEYEVGNKNIDDLEMEGGFHYSAELSATSEIDDILSPDRNLNGEAAQEKSPDAISSGGFTEDKKDDDNDASDNDTHPPNSSGKIPEQESSFARDSDSQVQQDKNSLSREEPSSKPAEEKLSSLPPAKNAVIKDIANSEETLQQREDDTIQETTQSYQEHHKESIAPDELSSLMADFEQTDEDARESEHMKTEELGLMSDLKSPSRPDKDSFELPERLEVLASDASEDYGYNEDNINHKVVSDERAVESIQDKNNSVQSTDYSNIHFEPDYLQNENVQSSDTVDIAGKEQEVLKRVEEEKERLRDTLLSEVVSSKDVSQESREDAQTTQTPEYGDQVLDQDAAQTDDIQASTFPQSTPAEEPFAIVESEVVEGEPPSVQKEAAQPAAVGDVEKDPSRQTPQRERKAKVEVPATESFKGEFKKSPLRQNFFALLLRLFLWPIELLNYPLRNLQHEKRREFLKIATILSFVVLGIAIFITSLALLQKPQI